MKKIFVAIAGVAVLALTTSGLMAGTAGAATTVKTATTTAKASCKEVLFLGARGSGEFGPGDYGFNSTRIKGDPYGFGGEVNSSYKELKGDLGAKVSVQPVSVSYPANSALTTLERAPNLYFTGLGNGVKSAVAFLTKQDKACPYQAIVLSGYSSGAMVQHRVLHQLINAKDTSILNRIYGAILIADGDQVANDNETYFGTAPKAASGIGHWYTHISHTSGAPFPAKYSNVILRVCNNHDPVCNASHTDLNLLNLLIHVHYTNSMPVLDAADVASRPHPLHRLPSQPVQQRLLTSRPGPVRY